MWILSGCMARRGDTDLIRLALPLFSSIQAASGIGERHGWNRVVAVVDERVAVLSDLVDFRSRGEGQRSAFGIGGDGVDQVDCPDLRVGRQ